MTSNKQYQSKIYNHHTSISQSDIDKRSKSVKDDKLNYPQIHIAPEYGLLNDPNGLAFFNGEYHIFYQYCPNGVGHGMKNWYHLTTKDFINYQRHGIKLSGDNDFDNYGAFSGGALVTEDYLYLLYTGNHREPKENYKRSSYQCIGRMSKQYEVEECSVIIEPNFKFHTEHFRDPVVAGSNLIIGMQSLDLKGKIAIIKDFDIHNKSELQLTTLQNDWNIDCYMFECPTWFETSGNEVIIFSPQGIEANDKYQFQNINDVVYSIGQKGDINNGVWSNCEYKQLDHGFDFYAPQTFTAEDSQLLIGWLGQASTIYPGDEQNEWSQMLTIVRELTVEDDQLFQTPHPNYKQLRGEWIELSNQFQLIDKVFEVQFKATDNFKFSFGNDQYMIQLSRVGNEICLDRSNMQYPVSEQYGTKRYVQLDENDTAVQMFVDRSAVEIYINSGKYVMTSRFFIDQFTTINMEGIDAGKLSYLKPISYLEGE